MTTAKSLTADVLAAFVGGQFKTKSFRDSTRRGEISQIVVDGRIVRVHLLWSAIRHGSTWYKDSVSEQTFDLRKCRYRKDVGTDAGVLRIDCPYSQTTMTFYPKGHKKNIGLGDIKALPL